MRICEFKKKNNIFRVKNTGNRELFLKHKKYNFEKVFLFKFK